MLVAVIIAFFFGCSDSRTQRAPIEDSTLVEVLIELHLAAARAEVTHSVPTGIRDSVMATYGVDSAAFAETITHLASEPEKYGEIYSQVIDRLNSERVPLAPDEPIDPTLDADNQGFPNR